LPENQVPEEPIKIFYSYSRKDLEMRNTLEDHLSALREANRISTWHDLQLEAGTEWEPAILNKLDTADIILLLVSRNFIASKYCYGTELKRAIARHDAGAARVIPIILRPCDWNHSDVPFSKLNVLPTHAKAITSWADQEEAFTIVAQQLRLTVAQLRAKKQAAQQAVEQQLLAQKEEEAKTEQERLQREQRQVEGQERRPQAALKEQAAEVEQQRQRELEQQRVLRQQLEDAKRQQTEQSVSVDKLTSDRGVDYTHLRDLLQAGEWEAADQETAKRMFEVMGWQQEGGLRAEDLQNFPCNDLRTIDQLWVTYSKGWFGLSIQKQIWVEVGEDYNKFGERVGWRVSKTIIRERGILWMKRAEEAEQKQWLKYNQLTFSMDVPRGHLPVKGEVWKGPRGDLGPFWRWASLTQRLVECKR